MTFAREAWIFVLPAAVATLIALLLQWPRSALALGLAAALLLAFFRIPERRFAGPACTLLAPANGKITAIDAVAEPLLGAGRYQRVTTFLSVFDVHVQRAPCDGRVVASRFASGRKVAAFRPEAGQVNESHFVVLETPTGDRIGVKQIAGLVARRVVSYLEEDQVVRRGDLIGVIKFGSRVDLYLPESYAIRAAPGQRVIEGLTPIADSGAGSPALRP